MDFAQFRTQNAAQAPKQPEEPKKFDGLTGEVNSNPEAEKEHQNKALLKMKGDSVWIPKLPTVPGLSEARKTHHKVKIHFGNGKSEIRMVDDNELGVLRRSGHITKVFNIAEMKDGVEHSYSVPSLFEDACREQEKNTAHYSHKDGSKAYLMTHKYSDPKLGTDHYVGFSHRTGTVYSNDDGKVKAERLLRRLGYKAKAKE
jgi:hypothetical protein